jgi:hypothetical protein
MSQRARTRFMSRLGRKSSNRLQDSYERNKKPLLKFKKKLKKKVKKEAKKVVQKMERKEMKRSSKGKKKGFHVTARKNRSGELNDNFQRFNGTETMGDLKSNETYAGTNEFSMVRFNPSASLAPPQLISFAKLRRKYRTRKIKIHLDLDVGFQTATTDVATVGFVIGGFFSNCEEKFPSSADVFWDTSHEKARRLVGNRITWTYKPKKWDKNGSNGWYFTYNTDNATASGTNIYDYFPFSFYLKAYGQVADDKVIGKVRLEYDFDFVENIPEALTMGNEVNAPRLPTTNVNELWSLYNDGSAGGFASCVETTSDYKCGWDDTVGQTVIHVGNSEGENRKLFNVEEKELKVVNTDAGDSRDSNMSCKYNFKYDPNGIYGLVKKGTIFRIVMSAKMIYSPKTVSGIPYLANYAWIRVASADPVIVQKGAYLQDKGASSISGAINCEYLEHSSTFDSLSTSLPVNGIRGMCAINNVIAFDAPVTATGTYTPIWDANVSMDFQIEIVVRVTTDTTRVEFDTNMDLHAWTFVSNVATPVPASGTRQVIISCSAQMLDSYPYIVDTSDNIKLEIKESQNEIKELRSLVKDMQKKMLIIETDLQDNDEYEDASPMSSVDADTVTVKDWNDDQLNFHCLMVANEKDSQCREKYIQAFRLIHGDKVFDQRLLATEEKISRDHERKQRLDDKKERKEVKQMVPKSKISVEDYYSSRIDEKNKETFEYLKRGKEKELDKDKMKSEMTEKRSESSTSTPSSTPKKASFLSGFF